MNTFLNFIKEHIIIISIILLLIILILSISPYFLLVLLPLLSLLPYIVNNKNPRKILELLDKYKPTNINEPESTIIGLYENKYGGNKNDILNEQIKMYVNAYINNIIEDQEISDNDKHFLLLLLKIKIKTKYDININIKEYEYKILDIYQLSDNIKKYFKNEIDKEISDKLPENIQKDISYLKDLFQVIDNIKSLGTIDENNADLYILEELNKRSKNKNYSLYFYPSQYIYNNYNHSEKFYKYIYDAPFSNDKSYNNIVSKDSDNAQNKEFYESLWQTSWDFYNNDNIHFRYRLDNNLNETNNSMKDDTVPNFDNIKEHKKPFYVKLKNMPKFNTNKTEEKIPEQIISESKYTDNKKEQIFFSKKKYENYIIEKPCPAADILDKKYTKKELCDKKFGLKIHPDRNRGCNILSTEISKDKVEKCSI